MARGGDHGGGPLVRRIELSECAARYVKQRATIASTRYRKQEADATASQIFELLASGAAFILPMSEDIKATIPWLEEAKTRCFDEAAQRGIDQLIAAIVVAKNK